MALSPNYGFPEPDNSSLVKNGAQDIRALGDAVDTAIWNVGFGQAGKNKFINGDFYINQRAVSSTTSTNAFPFDRWKTLAQGGTSTYSSELFTLGTAPVAGYEGKTFLRVDSTGQSAASDRTAIRQYIESVRTFAGQTVTVSFWAKAGSGTPKVAIEISQGFGTGGSPSSEVNTYGGQATLSTSWTRYSLIIAIPSISGKTIGTANDDSLQVKFFTSAGTDFNARTGSLGIQTATIDFWGVQVEAGSVATAFQTATGTIQGELAACQRYYQRITPSGQFTSIGSLLGISATSAIGNVPLRTSMRIVPTSLDYSNLTVNDGSTAQNITNLTVSSSSSPEIIKVSATVASGLTQYRPYEISASSATNYLGFSAEL